MQTNPFSLENKRILITGASSGIGKEIAIQSSNFGASLFITGRNKERLGKTKELLSDLAPHQSFIGDLTDSEFLNDFIPDLEPLDGIVLNAGIMRLLPLKSMTDEIIDELIGINFVSQVKLLRDLLKKRKIKKNASIVFVTSINGGVVGTKAHSLYASSKAALTGFARSLAVDLGSNKIRVNCIAPGMIETEGAEEIYATVSKESIDADKLKYPLRSYGQPKDVAFAAIYLLSEASKWVTGTTLVVDGGFTAQ